MIRAVISDGLASLSEWMRKKALSESTRFKNKVAETFGGKNVEISCVPFRRIYQI